MTYFDIDALRHGFSSRDFLDESWSHGLGEVHLVIGDVELYLGVALGAYSAPVPGDGDVSSVGVSGGHRGIRIRVGLQCRLVPHAAGHVKAIPLGHEAPVRAWHVLLRQDGFSEVRGASVVGQDVGAGGCGGVVGVGVVDLDIVDGGRLTGGGNGVDGDGVPVVVAQAVAGLDVSGGGEALAVDVQGVGWSGLQVAVAGADPDGGRVLVGEGPGDRGGGGLAGVGVWSEWFFSDSGDPVFWWRDRMGLCRE